MPYHEPMRTVRWLLPFVPRSSAFIRVEHTIGQLRSLPFLQLHTSRGQEKPNVIWEGGPTFFPTAKYLWKALLALSIDGGETCE